MCASTSDSRPDSSSSRSCPTNRDLDRLVASVRMAAEGRDLPERVVEWYEDWIFLFLAWCLKAPPHRIDRERIGDFWVALTDHPGVPRWKVCQAMDALGVLFGALGGPEALALPTGPPPQAADDPEAEAPSHYLPAGALPESVDARAEVPTQAARPEEADAPPTEEVEPPVDRQSTPKTLFNPTGTPPSEGGVAASGSHVPAGQTTPADWEESSAVGDPGGAPGDKVALNIPGPAAERLGEVSDELDLPVSFLLVRAIDLLREKTGVTDGRETNTSALLRQDPSPADRPHRADADEATGEASPFGEDDQSEPPSSAGDRRGGQRPSLRGSGA